MEIDFATESDYEFIQQRDHHVLTDLLMAKIRAHEVYIVRNEEGSNIGWMRFGYFWDNTPFMNLIWIEEQYRGKGIGQEVVQRWERDMKQKGFKTVMTSTQSDEDAQHFYRKLEYRDAGCLLLDTQPLEIILIKDLE
ncbi:GNAT family N-acetyltransferase [Alicyclobacillus fastidiosus]|uniref:GNAT family N-acetyltransferase n=1 Tax=Alicyclobacillus fastidiosus TaxID=392011 RepID=A0ABY6ZHP6_9BACL|nr:GNAT family N-acetyltransferase [Alicyclobacillus fastidiosus]WAH42384.1 GNAT family N-acetyltransferase [Alicyclobacillus fastidiosus]GMA64200.1 N-acetyltransferase [Alicyclobacillus fastidiosus]